MPKEKLTRQGVRDLDAKLGPVKKGRVLEEPPKEALVGLYSSCRHRNTHRYPSGHVICEDCDRVLRGDLHLRPEG